MLKINYRHDPNTGEEIIETNLAGKPLLTTPQLNKGTAFTTEEREAFSLLGKLPYSVETIDHQVQRCYKQFARFKSKLEKNIYLNNLHNQNQVLFYRLVSENLAEMMPIIYTPIVGSSVKKFSSEFRQTRGLYLTYPERDKMEAILTNRSNPDIDLIVVTDGEGVLGIGDQGIGGMDIPVAKLMVYTICGGINHLRTLPILLDVGTNNEHLLNDPLYLGWRHERLSGAEYDAFIDHFVGLLKKHFPQVFLHWEDFGRNNARRHLNTYKDEICTFNDDMQGTGAVTVSALLAAIDLTQTKFEQQKIVVFGAGTAGTGISDHIRMAMEHDGLDKEQACKRFWLLDRNGLLVDDQDDLTQWQQPYAQPRDSVANWELQNPDEIGLLDVIKNVKPTILIGCSAVTGAFTETVVKEMARHVERPIILPLSNPTEHAEAIPSDLLAWTEGKALIATGSPFPQVTYHKEDVPIAQCNNALVFPGIGLGILAVKAKRCSDEMLWAACKALSRCAPTHRDKKAALLPNLSNAREVARDIAIAVAEQAVNEQLNALEVQGSVEAMIDAIAWQPNYPTLKRVD